MCADCEEGPIGFHDTSSKKAFYVALDRVLHEGVDEEKGTHSASDSATVDSNPSEPNSNS